jgi:hypothetical protein
MRKEIEKRTAHKPETSILFIVTYRPGKSFTLGRRVVYPCWHIPIPRTHRCKEHENHYLIIIDHCRGSTHGNERSKKTKFESFALAGNGNGVVMSFLRPWKAATKSLTSIQFENFVHMWMDWQNSWIWSISTIFSRKLYAPHNRRVAYSHPLKSVDHGTDHVECRMVGFLRVCNFESTLDSFDRQRLVGYAVVPPLALVRLLRMVILKTWPCVLRPAKLRINAVPSKFHSRGGHAQGNNGTIRDILTPFRRVALVEQTIDTGILHQFWTIDTDP